ncbi:MAG: PQQ-dependent sugar dehydrogenase, partial [Stagnimonas sp.]|nr:PQQ-dependent sugar dehydrogenase [Stagnimonas sp.]
GRNYGWPVITYGREYSGLRVGAGLSQQAGMGQPVHYWVPSIAPSGMAFYSSDRIPAWKGSLFVASLKFGQLARLSLDGDRVVAEERLLEGLNRRLRDARQGPDGALYLLTDESPGAILRLTLTE